VTQALGVISSGKLAAKVWGSFDIAPLQRSGNALSKALKNDIRRRGQQG